MPDSGSRPSRKDKDLRKFLKLKPKKTRKNKPVKIQVPNDPHRENAHIRNFLQLNPKANRKMMWCFSLNDKMGKSKIITDIFKNHDHRDKRGYVSVTTTITSLVVSVLSNTGSSATFKLDKDSGKITATADGVFLNSNGKHIPAILIVKDMLETKQFMEQKAV